jgi:2-C-methyl-D-erythritol 4-phosphate cytidylyltransferase
MASINCDAIIVAGGAGTRLRAAVPKAFVGIGKNPMLVYSLLEFDSHDAVRNIMLVIPPYMHEDTGKIVAGLNLTKPVTIVDGGKERWQSVKNGVDKSSSEWALIHDAARPFVSHAVIDSVIEKSDKYEAVITVTPEVDTIRTFKDDRALETVDRSRLVRVGTPQMFKTSILKNALNMAPQLENPPTDEAMLMEIMGVSVGIAWGDPINFKITTQADLKIAQALL